MHKQRVELRKRRRIVIIAGYAPSLLNFRGALLKAFVGLGWEVVACAPGSNSAIAFQLAKVGISYRRVRLNRTGLNPFSDAIALIHLCWILFRIKPTVVLSYTIKPVIFGSIAARLCGVTGIYSMITGAGSSFSNESLVRKLVEALYRFALSGNRVVFFQNPDDCAEFRQRRILRSNAKTIVLSGSGVDLQRFAWSRTNSQDLVFLLIARLIAEKGINEFTCAARRLKLRYPSCRFVLLGPYDTNPSSLSRSQVTGWVEEGIIEYAGETRDVRPFLESASVFVLPSFYREGTPRTILEAMAIGRPVITTDAPGCRETICRKSEAPCRNAEKLKGGNAEMDALPAGVTRGENGFLVPVRDASSLAWAMEQFILQPNLISEMGLRSREYAEKRYDVHQVNRVILREMGLLQSEELVQSGTDRR